MMLTERRGVTADGLQQFMSDAAAFLECKDSQAAVDEQGKSVLMTFGDRTPVAYEAIEAVREKVDEYFELCRIVRFQQEFETLFTLSEDECKQRFTNLQALNEKLSLEPIAIPDMRCVFDFSGKINPVFEGILLTFQQSVLDGKTSMSLDEWRALKLQFVSYKAWVEDRKGASVEKLGVDRLKFCLESDLAERLNALINTDLSVAGDLGHVFDLEKTDSIQTLAD